MHYHSCFPSRNFQDRRHVKYDPENPWDPVAYRHKAVPGDFELESLEIEDLLITVYQPDSFRPDTASIFNADIQTFRKSWMFYDFLCADNVVGQFDNCLFSLHKPQSIGRTTEQLLKDAKLSRMVIRLQKFSDNTFTDFEYRQDSVLTALILITSELLLKPVVPCHG